MPDEISYDLKYGALIECLAGQRQIRWWRDYPPHIAKHFENIDSTVLSSYMTELERDFDDLYALALTAALNDAELAERLVRTRDALRRFKRLLRARHLSVAANANADLRALLRNMQDLRHRSQIRRPCSSIRGRDNRWRS